MKKVLTIAALALTGYAANAQDFYAMAGLNLANITKDANGGTQKNNMLTTFNVGALGRFDINKNVGIETGLIFQGRGSKTETYFTSSTTDNYVKSKFNPYYLEVPANIVVKVPEAKLFLHAGPYGAIGIGGKAKTEAKILGISSTTENKIKFNNDDITTSQQEGAAYDKLKLFDYGINVGGGFYFNNVLIRANYGLGLAKINSTQTNNSADDKNKYRTISVSVGFPLGN